MESFITAIPNLLGTRDRFQGRQFSKGWASLATQTVKNLPAIQETWVRSLGREDPLEKGMATHSSILAWRIPWTEEPGSQNSLVVLWLGLGPLTARDPVRSLVRELRSCNPPAAQKIGRERVDN